MASHPDSKSSSWEFFGYEALRYGYFWPFPNTPKNGSANVVEVPREPSLEDVDREMEGRDTLKDIPVFAMRVQEPDLEHIPFSTSPDGSPTPNPIVADRIIMLSVDPMREEHTTLLAEIDSGWDA